jgi:hypothetical protein
MATVVVAMSSTNGAWRPAGERDRIGREHGLAAERRHHRHVGRVRHAEPDHVVLERHHRVVGGSAVVSRVADGDHAQAIRARFLDARLHRPGGDVVAEALLPVEETGGHLVTHDRRLGVHTDIAGLPQLVVAREHADPVRVDTAQVGAHHEPGRHLGDRARHLHGDERGDEELLEPGVADEDR